MSSHFDQLRGVLGNLGSYLEVEYLRTRIWNEADLVVSAVGFLRKELRTRSSFWFVGTQHRVRDRIPDVVCYAAPGPKMPSGFFDNREDYLVGLVEFKFATRGKDLEKLTIVQKSLGASRTQPVLAWYVYASHFSPEIHRKYAKMDEDHEHVMRQWVSEAKATRGITVLRLGVHKDWENSTQRKVRKRLNQQYWILDRNAKKIQLQLLASSPESVGGDRASVRSKTCPRRDLRRPRHRRRPSGIACENRAAVGCRWGATGGGGRKSAPLENSASAPSAARPSWAP